ncbi:preQ(0) biosynthesis protein QueE [Sinobaca qinghaiensis]|uniref:7-carboxy-7-deazaguanine synthase n=1 Tax=Sinobaca qinghaiensis TaxID=342944 RepID=A0A419V6Z5_9BACL|nr:7-carboxy-7-deazaguanine synthase QueE [Sinobaca qinghaiensis]RKD75637.1 preQ(0) biosynthesis protein QueE [Sinobaca qinghaiensis]
MKKIPVLEIFGPTIQGEGMVIGQKTMFVRTGGCDYRCSWCDSAFTWDGSQKAAVMDAASIVEKLYEKGTNLFSHVTISGGNPAIHPGIHSLIEELRNQGIQTAVETQGSIWAEWMIDIDEVTISPKPPSSLMKTDWEKLDYYINRLERRPNKAFSLKIVIFNKEDLEYAAEVHTRYPNAPMFLQVGNDDLTEKEAGMLRDHLLERYEWLISETMDDARWNDVKILPQLHTLLWGNKQGV